MSLNRRFPLLVTGASGHLGRGVLTHLLETLQVPADRIIATTRKPAALADIAARGVTVRAADFDDAASLSGAFAGAQRLLLISTDTLDRPGARLAQHRNAIEAAVKVGVRHVLYTSMPQPEGSPILFAPDHWGTEQALAASPLSWTVLRNCWYFENLFLSLHHILATGKWYTSAGAGRMALIARDDAAHAAAAALASGETDKKVYTLTGSEAYTTAEIAQRVSEMAGKPIEVVQVPDEGLVQGMVAGGLPEAVARVFTSFDTNTRMGRVARITDDFRHLTGVEPQKYRAWLAANKTAIAGA
jgi:NAD(P)H dehydrogenase (quinone)